MERETLSSLLTLWGQDKIAELFQRGTEIYYGQLWRKETNIRCSSRFDVNTRARRTAFIHAHCRKRSFRVLCPQNPFQVKIPLAIKFIYKTVEHTPPFLLNGQINLHKVVRVCVCVFWLKLRVDRVNIIKTLRRLQQTEVQEHNFPFLENRIPAGYVQRCCTTNK